jgi:argininosuccinate lyase
LVLQGVPFRDAYKQVGKEIEEGSFTPNYNINHNHEGSIGNLCNAQITAQKDLVLNGFGFEKKSKAIKELLER